MFNRKTATAPAATTAELIVTEAISQIAASETQEVEVTKIPTGMTSKKAAATAKAAAKKAATDTTETTAAINAERIHENGATTETTVSPFSTETNTAILAIVPAKKTARVGDTVAARKALFDANAAVSTVAERKAKVIELLCRNEGAVIGELQTFFWLASAAILRLVEKDGYTTRQEKPATGTTRYFAKKV
jgi:hypothetical protein